VEPIGRAWIKNGWHNIYSMHTIKKGRDKGLVVVEYIHRFQKTKKVAVPAVFVRPKSSAK